jgi:hypothetical protein
MSFEGEKRRMRKMDRDVVAREIDGLKLRPFRSENGNMRTRFYWKFPSDYALVTWYVRYFLPSSIILKRTYLLKPRRILTRQNPRHCTPWKIETNSQETNLSWPKLMRRWDIIPCISLYPFDTLSETRHSSWTHWPGDWTSLSWAVIWLCRNMVPIAIVNIITKHQLVTLSPDIPDAVHYSMCVCCLFVRTLCLMRKMICEWVWRERMKRIYTCFP